MQALLVALDRQKIVATAGCRSELTEHLGHEKHDPAGRGSGKLP